MRTVSRYQYNVSRRAHGPTRRLLKQPSVLGLFILTWWFQSAHVLLAQSGTKREPGETTTVGTTSKGEPSLWPEVNVEPSSPKACLMRNGLAYGPFRDGQAPSGPGNLLPFPTADQVAEDIDFLGRITGNVRIYASGGDYSQIAPLAKHHNPSLGVMQGISLRWDAKKSKKENDDDNKQEIDAAVSMSRKGLVDSIIVGNETFLQSGSGRGARLPKAALVDYIHQVRKEVKPAKIPVSTAQVFSDWESNLDLASEVDFIVAHFYPFWEVPPVPAEQAAGVVLKNYHRLKDDLRAKVGREMEVVIGETGWPSGGEPRGDAVPSPKNERTFISEFMPLACENSIRFYYFSAFDEEWKWDEGGDDEWKERYRRPRRESELPYDRTLSGNWIGSSWGIFQSNGKLKTELTDLFSQPGRGSRASRDIFLYEVGRLSAFYDMGVDSIPDHAHDWVDPNNGELRMAYPSNQHSGFVFITVGEPKPSSRPWKDFSEFETLSMEMRAEGGEKKVEVGIKNRTDPDNGNETRILEALDSKYRTYKFPLRKFASKTHLRVPEGLKQLYVVVEFVFEGPKAETVYARNIRYEPN